MSEHIVHTGILEDSAAIAPYLSGISEDFIQTMQQHLNFAKLGAITVAGDQFSFRLLEEIRPLWKKRDDLLEAKLAFVLGWISHRACDRQMKPIWSVIEITGKGSDANPAVSPTECSVYHEGEMYNLYYKDDPAFRFSIFPEELKKYPGSELFNLEMAENFAQFSFGMNLMDIQTFSLPPTDQRFMEDVCIRSQKFYVALDRYTRAAGDPDPKNKKEFVTEINWYDKNDPVISLANQLREGNQANVEKKMDFVLEKPASSHYGQALQLSLSYILSASKYFADEKMTITQLKENLDIGKKGPGGLPV